MRILLSLLIVAASLATVGCEAQPPIASKSSSAASTPRDASAANHSVRIGSFNIQVFGESKVDKPQVMEILVDVARRFDVMAIQEIRAKNQDIIPHFVNLINANGDQYDYVLGPRLGRTNSKEQYAFIFDSRRIQLEEGSVYTMSDPQDFLHREPLVASFRARGLPAAEAFRFTLINIHTDPDETDTELDALGDVFRAVQSQGEDDVILLGDLNVSENKLGRLGQTPGITWTVRGEPTNTRGNKSYDNFLFHEFNTREYLHRSGVFDLQREYRLSLDQALEVSDHLPVWAEFSPREGGSAIIATRPN